MKYRSMTHYDSWMGLSCHLSCRIHISKCPGEIVDAGVPEKAK